jgi:hypothetical protein
MTISRAAYIAMVERCLRLETGAPAPVVQVPFIARRRISPKLDTQIRALWASGDMARTQIVEQLGVSYNAVYVRTKGTL